MLEYNSEYRVLICPIHKYAVHDADEHLRSSHCITGREKDALLDQWKGLDLVNPKHFNRQPSGRRPKDFLNQPVPGYSCSSCFFLSIKREVVQDHHRTVHGREIALAPVTTGQNPDVQLVELQTFFPYPHIRWFTVDDKNDDRSDEDGVTRNDVKNEESVVTELSEGPTAQDPADEMLAQAKASENRYRYGSNIREQQRSQAPKLREANASSLYLARLPLEIRQEIYKLVLGSGTVFHIMDEFAIVKPDLPYIVGTDEHDKEDVFRGVRELRDDWEDDLEEVIVDAQYEAGEMTRFRAVSIPKSTPHALALLRVCSHFNEEATSIFYSSNQFRLHSGTSNFSTALQFLNLLSPEIRKCITAFGVTGLQPCMKAGPGRYGFQERTYEFKRKCRAYYQSEEMFFSNALPQMALKEINLGFDLSHLEVDTSGMYEVNENFGKEYSPQASWLNRFLRLPLERIDLTFGNLDWKDGFGDIPPVGHLIEALNHVDGQTRIRAKYEWDDRFEPKETYEDCHPEEARRYEEMYGPIYPYNDIWK